MLDELSTNLFPPLRGQFSRKGEGARKEEIKAKGKEGWKRVCKRREGRARRGGREREKVAKDSARLRAVFF